jgi:exopolysaccharide production protein ExoZ
MQRSATQVTPDRAVMPGIQALRWLAAMAVVCRHILAGFDFHGYPLGPFRGLNIGLWGVDLFFVISGFIMVVTTQGQPATGAASARFMLRRFLRLSPLYYLLTFIALTGLWVRGTLGSLPETLIHLVCSLLYLPHRDPFGVPMPVHGIGWTLNFEMYFYAVFALLMLTGRLLPGMLIWCACMVGLGYVVPSGAIWWWQVTNPMLISFTLGVLAAHLWIAGRVPAWLSSRLALLALGLMVGIDVLVPTKLDGLRVVFALLAVVALLGVLRVSPQGWSHPLQSAWRALVGLGDESYALYLVHPLVLVICIQLFKTWGRNGVGASLTAALVVLSSLASARLLYRGFERPMHQRTNAWVRRHWPDR